MIKIRNIIHMMHMSLVLAQATKQSMQSIKGIINGEYLLSCLSLEAGK